MGQSLARNEQRDMKTADLLQGLELLEQFETDFSMLSEQRRNKGVKALEDAGR